MLLCRLCPVILDILYLLFISHLIFAHHHCHLFIQPSILPRFYQSHSRTTTANYERYSLNSVERETIIAMDFDLSSLSDPRDFPARFSFLRDVDRELRCAICAEFLDSAVALPCCGVAYCSLCLRSALAAGEAKCPNHLCRKPSCEASIR